MAQSANKDGIEQPRTITHVGVTVTDVDAAIDWYQRVLGFQLLQEPVEYTAGEGYFGKLVADMLGPKVVRGRIAMMDAGNGVGLELFDFADPKPDPRSAEENQEFYLHKTGTFHFCVIDPDVEGLARRIAETGGKQRSAVWEFAPGVNFFVCYCEDPFGNIVEIYCHRPAPPADGKLPAGGRSSLCGVRSGQIPDRLCQPERRYAVPRRAPSS